MKKDIFLLGSTGSIGETTLKVIKKHKSNFNVKLLSTNKNIKKIYKQAIQFDVKNIVIFDKNSYLKNLKKFKDKKIKVFTSITEALRRNKKKSFLTINGISGIEGLEPTLDIIKYSNNLAIANKESIICGWQFIAEELKKKKTGFIPLDSEHFSIWSLLKNESKKNIKKIYLTASGGPFLNKPLSKLKNVSYKQAIKHPNWKMGKKISIDSATMMNKVFEIIEAKNIFGISYKKLDILTHPSSYVHAILKFRDGLTNIILHDTTMRIPIYNTLYSENDLNLNSKKLNLKILNNLNFEKIDLKKFPLVKIINYLPEKISLFETVIVSANDKLVDYYLNGQIKFDEIQTKLLKFINNKEFRKFKRIKPKKIENIINLNKYVRLKIKL